MREAVSHRTSYLLNYGIQHIDGAVGGTAVVTSISSVRSKLFEGFKEPRLTVHQVVSVLVQSQQLLEELPVLIVTRFRGQHDYAAALAVLERNSNSSGLM